MGKNNHMETKQHPTKKPMSQQWNQRGNQKIPRDKWQWKHNLQNLWDAAKVVQRGKFRAIQAFLEQQVKSQVNNLTYHLKELEKRRINKTQSH